MGIAISLVLGLLTAWWIVGMWRHFVSPPKDADFDWGMTHGFYVFMGGALLAGLWIGLWRLVWGTVLQTIGG